ncbi:hypothetical protein Taro_000306 [Colocasia esculenta]|uniref:Uncharacterized protein n=1 Tax=Colocasia esculenta TaxID=4460 RepID=A0A843TG89_COLES|nr:hypothetical protein [Colocasia esculenta]
MKTGRISPVDMSGSGENGEEDTKKLRFFRNERDRGRRSRRIEEVFGIEGCRRVNWSGLSER